MVKKLRLRYTATASLILLIVLIIIGVAINMLNYYNFIASTEKTMSIIAANNGEFPTLEDYNKMIEEETRLVTTDTEAEGSPAGEESDASSLPSGVESTALESEGETAEKHEETDAESAVETAESPETTGGGAGIKESGSVTDEDSADAEKESLGKFDYDPGIGFGLKVTAETAYETRYFSVKFTPSGEMLVYDLSHIAEVSVEDAEGLGHAVLKEDPPSGVYGNYRYYRHETKDGATEIIFLNCANQLRSLNFVLYISLFTLLAVLGAVTAAIWVMSKKIVKPFVENLEKQKRFITDAGHEIKTPLAIIDANAEVLKLTEGENEWIESIQNQTARLSSLIKKLVSLSKSEEGTVELGMEKFNVSDALSETVAPFVILAEKNGVSLETDISPDIFFKGNESSVRQLFGILLDNAIKYTPAGGKIRVSLENRGRCFFEFYNDCENLNVSKIPQYFDRFYRADDSRSRETGGYGIGLSIAKAIVDNHKGKISAASRDGKSITFTVIL